MDRKEFLELLGRSALFAATAPAFESVSGEGLAASRGRALTPRQRATLRLLADQIVPASDGMPSAGEVGAVAYLEPLAQREEAVAAVLRDALASVERRARRSHRRTFDQLTSAQRVTLLESMEKEEAERFRTARDLVYEAYYTNAQVWRRLGYDFIGAEDSGPPLEPFEEKLLERVRALPRLHRDAP